MSDFDVKLFPFGSQYVDMYKEAIGGGSKVSPKPQFGGGEGIGGVSQHRALSDPTFLAAIKNNPFISGNVEYGVNRPNPTYNATQLGRSGMSGINTNYVC